MSAIDYSWPITSGLVAAYVFTDGSAVNVVSGADTLSVTGDAFFDTDGLNCPNSGTSTGAILASPPSAFQPNDVTLMWFGKILGSGTISDNPFLAGMAHNNTNASPFVSYGLHRRNPFQTDLYCLYSTTGGSLHVIDMSTVIDTSPYGNQVNYLMTRTSGATTVYKNGSSIGSDSASGNLEYGGTANFCVNRHSTVTANSANTNVALVFLWNRVLTSGEIADIVANPRFFLLDSDFANGEVIFDGSVDGFSLLSQGEGFGDISIEGSVAGEILTFIADAQGDITFEGETGDQTIALIGDAQGDIVFDGEIEGPLAAVPIECITGDGVYTRPTSGNFAY